MVIHELKWCRLPRDLINKTLLSLAKFKLGLDHRTTREILRKSSTVLSMVENMQAQEYETPCSFTVLSGDEHQRSFWRMFV